jgi:concanavalin A-like lectin/glucanase superfamily protein
MRLNVLCLAVLGCWTLILGGCGDGGDSGTVAREDGVLVTFHGNLGVVPNAGNPRGDSGTITFDVTPEWDGTDDGNDSVFDIHTPNVWENHLKVFKNGQSLRLSVWPDSGVEDGVAMRIDAWMAGEHHRIAVVWTRGDSADDFTPGPGVASMYVDGVLIRSTPYDGTLKLPPGTPLYIGSDDPGSEEGKTAVVSQVRIFGRPLSSQEVAAAGDR